MFWILQASSWGLLLVNHSIWMYFDLVLRKDVPYLFAGDALLFVSGVPALAGLLLQPHAAESSAKNRLGIADFFLLLVSAGEQVLCVKGVIVVCRKSPVIYV